MNIDTVRENVTGLEDDDNFFELVRQRIGLESREEAVHVTQEVVLLLAQCLPAEECRSFLCELPKTVEDYVYPKLESDLSCKTFPELLRAVEEKCDVDAEQAARFVSGLGLTMAERISSEQFMVLQRHLSSDVLTFIPESKLAA